MKRKLSKICTSCLQPTHLFAAIILLLTSAVPVQKVYAAPSHGKAAPAGTSVSGQSPLSAARNEKLFHPLQLRQSLLTATVWKSAPDASAWWELMPLNTTSFAKEQWGTLSMRTTGSWLSQNANRGKKHNLPDTQTGQIQTRPLHLLCRNHRLECRDDSRRLRRCLSGERLCRTRGRSPPQPKRHLERHIYASPPVPPAEIPSEKAKAAKLI